MLGYIISKPLSANMSIKLIWVPSHSGIYRNEQADVSADSAADLDLSMVCTDLSCSVSLIRSRIHLLWSRQWTRLDIRNKIIIAIEPRATSAWHTRRDEVVFTRLKINATKLTHFKP